MEGRIRRYGNQTSPERTKVRVEPPPKRHHHYQQQQQQQQQGRKISVVYYLCRNRHLESPHFIEVPVSSPEGLFLRDVIKRLNVLRGKRMAAMYSWSCKRSYKNGFVWHDLSEDDLVLPAQGNEYVLKGSELVDQHPSRTKPIGARDASTQTDDNGGRTTRTASVSTDDGSFGTEFNGGNHHYRSPRSMEGLEIVGDEISPPWSASSLGAGRMDTLENLIRAEAAFRVNNFRITEESPMRVKLKATNLLMQLISCGSFSVKGYRHGLELVPTYRPRFAHANFSFSSPVVLGELGWRLDNSRPTGLCEYLGGSLTEAKNHEEERGASSSQEDR